MDPAPSPDPAAGGGTTLVEGEGEAGRIGGERRECPLLGRPEPEAIL